MNLKKMENKIRKARENLRQIANKYQTEFHDINMKIDKYLEAIENTNKEKENGE